MDFNLKVLVADGEFFSLDVEGDGHGEQRPVEISLLRYSRGTPVEEFHWLVNSGRPISPYVIRLHGITDAMVSGAPAFPEIRDEVAGLISGACVAAHNIKDDMRLLSTVFPDAPLLPYAMIDTARLARNLVREAIKFNLDDVSEALGVILPRERSYDVHTDFPDRGKFRHSAGVDSYLAGQCLVSMASRIDPAPKQVRHVSQASLYVLNTRQVAAIEAEMAARKAGGDSGVIPRV